MQILRRSSQGLVVLLALNAGVGLFGSRMHYGAERFCPFGGIETLWALVTRQSFTCAMGPYNLALMMALLGVTLVARKAFCAWICPVGTLSEWLGIAGRRLRALGGAPAEARPLGLSALGPKADRSLRGLPIVVLALVLLFTIGTGELVFRPYDPYYVLFSAGGHDVQSWSYLLVGGILLAAVILPMAWCRYLCPLGAALWPFARFGWLRVTREGLRCTSCGSCDRACPHGLAVSKAPDVRSGDCTLCLECTRACPTAGSLRIAPAGLPRVPVPAWSLLVLLVLATFLGFKTADSLSFTSFERRYVETMPPPQRLKHLSLAVTGVRCVDTAARAARQLEGIDGMVSLRAFAAEARLDLRFDTERTDPTAIIAGLEAPVWDEASGSFLFQVFQVREILASDSSPIPEPHQRSNDS